MKLRCFRMAAWSALVMTSSMLTFGGNQSTGLRADKNYPQTAGAHVTWPVQQVKGSVIARYEKVVRGNAYRSETAQGNRSVQDNTATARHDTAVRK